MSGSWPAKRRVVAEEIGLGSVRYRLLIAQGLVRLLPYGAAFRLRARLYRAGGIDLHPTAVILGTMRVWGAHRLSIGAGTTINTPCAIGLDEDVTIGRGVLIGHDTIIAAGDHHIGPHTARGGEGNPRPIVIGDGVWIGAGAQVLAGVTIGDGAVVGARSLVNRDVPADAIVAGIPARVLRTLPADAPSAAAP